MTRRLRRLLGISATVGVTLVVAWVLLQVLVIRPAIGGREQARTVQVLQAAELMRDGMTKREVEALRGIDLRVFDGQPEGPPPGTGWIRMETGAGVVFKRDGGKYDIAAWTGEVWAVIHEDYPFGWTSALVLFAGGVPVVIVLFALGRRAQRRQDTVELALTRIAAGDLGGRLDEDVGSRESRRLAVAVNRMAANVEALMESERQAAAGLSHELRTPLTRIRLELELARREGGPTDRLDRVERDIEAFDTMLTEMLDLSRMQLLGGQTLSLEIVDLAGLSALIVDEEGWTDVEIRGAGEASVDPGLVARLIRNVLRNSAQHAPSSARWIEVEDDVLRVGDEGPGIEPERQATLLLAFERGDASTGHGLGLAIVAQIAALHRAELTLSQPPGLVVSVRFPG